MSYKLSIARYHDHDAEDGAVIPILMLSIVALLSFIGLAIDGANLYRSKLALQNAADAAVLASIHHIDREGRYRLEARLEGISDSSSLADREREINKYLKEFTLGLIRANLISSGAVRDVSKVVLKDSSYKLGDKSQSGLGSVFTFEVNVTMPVDYLFFGALSSFGKLPTNLEVKSSAQRNVANVIILVDQSISSRCPVDEDCSCQTVTGDEKCDSSQEKRINRIARALGASLSKFDLERDRIIVSPFSTRAKVWTASDLRKMSNIREEKDLTNAEINLITQVLSSAIALPKGSSNMSDGLISSFSKLQEIAPEQPFTVLAITDGAQSAARALFTDPQYNLPPSNDVSGLRDYSYFIFGVVDEELGSFYGPTPLYRGEDIDYDHDPFRKGASACVRSFRISQAMSGIPCNHALRNYCPAFEYSYMKENTEEHLSNELLGLCLKSLNAHMPGNSEYEVKCTVDGQTPKDCEPKRSLEFPYYYLLAMADYMRQKKGRFYAVSYGQPDGATSSNPSDPFENIYNMRSLKSVFLDRFTLDERSQSSSQPGFDFVLLKRGKVVSSGHNFGQSTVGSRAFGNSLRGKHLHAPSDAEVSFLIDQAVREVLERLVK